MAELASARQHQENPGRHHGARGGGYAAGFFVLPVLQKREERSRISVRIFERRAGIPGFAHDPAEKNKLFFALTRGKKKERKKKAATKTPPKKHKNTTKDEKNTPKQKIPRLRAKSRS